MFLSKSSFGQFKTDKRVGKDHVYTVKNVAPYNVKVSKDNSNCSIYGCYFLPSGQVATTDYSNKRVKLLNKHYSLISLYVCDNNPLSICHISGSEICVACRDHLQFLTVSGNQLKPGRKVTLDHKARTVAHHQGQLYVGGEYSGLCMYTATGQLVKQVYKGFVNRCCVGANGTIYITTGSNNELIVLDNQGRVQSKFKDTGVKNTIGLCKLPNGNVMVCGHDTNNIVQFDPQGQNQLSTLLTSADSMSMPASVCFNQTTQTLIIGQTGNASILAVELK